MPLNLGAIATLRAAILTATEEAAAEVILAPSNEYIPKDTLTAEESGRVITDVPAGIVWITYGKDDDRNPKTGESSNTYIEPLHEDLSQQHAAGTGAKFLERAADEAVPSFGAVVAAKAKV